MDLNELMDIRAPNVGSEDSAWATIRKHLVDKQCHIQRFEDKLSGGIPDSNICYPGGYEFWFEGKFLREYPKRQGTRVQVGLREDQRNWLRQRKKAGATCIVWIREPRGWRYVTDRFEELHDGIPLHMWDAVGSLHDTSQEMVEALIEHVVWYRHNGIPTATTTRT